MKTIEETYRYRLKLLAKELGSQVALANKIDRSASQVGQWINGSKNSKTGKPRSLSSSTARYIEKMTGKPEGWMDQPIENTPQATGDGNATDGELNYATIGQRHVPLISFELEDAALNAVPKYLLSDLTLSDHAFALTIDDDDDSMAPEFIAGDNIIVDPSISPRPGDYVVAKIDKTTVMRRYKLRGSDDTGQQIIELIPLNDYYPTIRSDREPIQIIGTVVEKTRRYRRDVQKLPKDVDLVPLSDTEKTLVRLVLARARHADVDDVSYIDPLTDHERAEIDAMIEHVDNVVHEQKIA